MTCENFNVGAECNGNTELQIDHQLDIITAAKEHDVNKKPDLRFKHCNHSTLRLLPESALSIFEQEDTDVGALKVSQAPNAVGLTLGRFFSCLFCHNSDCCPIVI